MKGRPCSGRSRSAPRPACAAGCRWASRLDAVVGLHILRGAISDVLVDALVLDEVPAFAETLDQLKVLNGFLDRVVCATMRAA